MDTKVCSRNLPPGLRKNHSNIKSERVDCYRPAQHTANRKVKSKHRKRKSKKKNKNKKTESSWTRLCTCNKSATVIFILLRVRFSQLRQRHERVYDATSTHFGHPRKSRETPSSENEHPWMNSWLASTVSRHTVSPRAPSCNPLHTNLLTYEVPDVSNVQHKSHVPCIIASGLAVAPPTRRTFCAVHGNRTP